MDLTEIWPPFGVRITIGDLTLQVVRDADIVELIELAGDGVHHPDLMPFTVPWTRDPDDVRIRESAKHYWRDRVECTPDRPRLEFVVRRNGEVVGAQGLTAAENYPVVRSLETGSWLGMRFHGQGIGTRMRQAVCAFAFDHLDAVQITSAAFGDNPSSQAVSRKVGYRPNGVDRLERLGKPAETLRLLLTPDTFVRSEEEVTVTGAAELRTFLELDRTE